MLANWQTTATFIVTPLLNHVGNAVLFCRFMFFLVIDALILSPTTGTLLHLRCRATLCHRPDQLRQWWTEATLLLYQRSNHMEARGSATATAVSPAWQCIKHIPPSSHSCNIIGPFGWLTCIKALGDSEYFVAGYFWQKKKLCFMTVQPSQQWLLKYYYATWIIMY